MCRQDVLEAATDEASNWSKARQTGILKVNILSLHIIMSDENRKNYAPTTPKYNIEVPEHPCRK